ncbi:MAG TPA: hypothetical protein VJU82_01345 [Acidobacteriaceae bacterium]|nr:hypothetical protein [Acidobacteriaceae bacterium]
MRLSIFERYSPLAKSQLRVACYASSVVRKPRKISAGAVPIVLGVLATLVVLCWMPWNIEHPLDPSLVITTVHAPLWSRPTSAWGRVELDEAKVVIRLLAIWAGVGLWLGLSSDRWS